MYFQTQSTNYLHIFRFSLGLKMKMLNVAWWFLFIVCSIIATKFFPGIDFLVIGFIILLEEEDIKQLLIMTPLLLVIQESTTTLSFGSILLWYSCIYILVTVGRWLFVTRTILFMIPFCLIASVLQAMIFIFMVMLEGVKIDISLTSLIEKQLAQAIVMCFLWWGLMQIRPAKDTTVTLQH